MNFRRKLRVWGVMAAVAGGLLLAGITALTAAGAARESVSAENTGDFGITPANSPVLLDVTYGYDGTAKAGRYVPVRITLTNQEETAFRGKIKVLTQQPDEDAYKFDIYQYDYPIILEGAENKEITVNVPLGNRVDQLYVSLLDEAGAELVRKRVKMNVSMEVAELFIGVLCDTPEQLQYLDGVGINYSMVRTKTVSLTAADLPEDSMGLDLFDVILITNYDTSQISAAQAAALQEWVKKGGTLLIGTGSRVGEALARFGTGLLEEPHGTAAMREVDMGVEYSINGPGDSFITVSCVEVSLHNGMEVLNSDEFPVLTASAREKGQIAVAAYDFVDIAQFCETQRSYVDKLFLNLLGEDRINELSSAMYNGGSSDYWMVQSMINVGNVDKIPNLPLYTVVILVYIGLAGPGLYLFLKHQERRRFYRSGVVVLSAIFAILIYLLGCKTRFKDTFFTYAAIQENSEDTVTESIYVNMRTPYNRPFHVAVDPSYDLYPVTRNYYYDMAPIPKFTGNEDYRVNISYGRDKTEINVQDITAFTPKYFSLKRKTGNEKHAGITGDITLFDGEVSGTVTNHFGYPVENAALMLYGQMILLEELEPGETKTLDGLPVLNYPLSNLNAAAKRISGGYRYREPDIKDARYMKALARTNILSFYLNGYVSSYNADAKIVAFSREQSESQFLLSGGYETHGMTMLISPVRVNIKKDGRTSRSALMRRPTVMSGQYYASANAAYGMEPVVLEYSLGSDVTVEKLDFLNFSDEFADNEIYGALTQFTGSMYFYNHDSGNYDLVGKGQTEFSGRELESYLSPGNTITVKYVSDNVSEQGWYMMLPMPTIVGRDK